MKYTLLDMVQTILSAMDSDEVNSITDTTEALQVAFAIRTAYYHIIALADLPELKDEFNLTASSSSTPVVMYKPSNVKSVEWIRYNKATTDDPSPNYVDVKYLPLKNFLDMMYQLNSTETEVDSFTLTVNGADTFKVLCRNDKFPEFYTTFDDYTVLFDSYDVEEEANLQSSKTLGFGNIVQEFLLTDGFIPNLDAQQFDLLLNEAKSTCFLEMKQTGHPKAEQAVRKGWITLNRSKHAFPHIDSLPDYGRKKP